jgi:hypothetical protein
MNPVDIRREVLMQLKGLARQKKGGALASRFAPKPQPAAVQPPAELQAPPNALQEDDEDDELAALEALGSSGEE